MLLKFIITTNLLLLATAATIENNETHEQEYDKDGLLKNTHRVTEHSYLGVSGTKVTEEYVPEDVNNTSTTEIPTCRSDEWQCSDLSCVSLKHKCDGSLHCEDGSDETRENCKGIERPILGLLVYCTTERSYLKDGVCPHICQHNAQPNYCVYAMLAEQQNKPEGLCVLPDFIKHGHYSITAKNRTSENGYANFSLQFECETGKELVGEPEPECVDGEWSTTNWPYCSDACKLNKQMGYTFTCKRDEKTKVCGDYVAIGTEVIVEKYDQTISNDSIKAYTFCTERQVLNVSSGCVQEVDTRQKTFEQDIMQKLSDFEKEFKETKQPSFAFEELVRNYRDFEQHVNSNTTELKVNIAVCDMNLDLMQTSS